MWTFDIERIRQGVAVDISAAQWIFGGFSHYSILKTNQKCRTNYQSPIK